MYLEAYWDTSTWDGNSEEYHTIMINPYDINGDVIGDYEEEECFEGYTYIIADAICEQFNALKTDDIYDFYSIREDVISSFNFKER